MLRSFTKEKHIEQTTNYQSLTIAFIFIYI